MRRAEREEAETMIQVVTLLRKLVALQQGAPEAPGKPGSAPAKPAAPAPAKATATAAIPKGGDDATRP
jgi:hypothetical protein